MVYVEYNNTINVVYVEYKWCNIFRMHVWWPLRQRPGVVLGEVSCV